MRRPSLGPRHQEFIVAIDGVELTCLIILSNLGRGALRVTALGADLARQLSYLVRSIITVVGKRALRIAHTRAFRRAAVVRALGGAEGDVGEDGRRIKQCCDGDELASFHI